MTRGTKSPGLAGKHLKMIPSAAWAPNPGEPAARIAADKILLHDALDDRPEKIVLPLEMME